MLIDKWLVISDYKFGKILRNAFQNRTKRLWCIYKLYSTRSWMNVESNDRIYWWDKECTEIVYRIKE